MIGSAVLPAPQQPQLDAGQVEVLLRQLVDDALNPGGQPLPVGPVVQHQAAGGHLLYMEVGRHEGAAGTAAQVKVQLVDKREELGQGSRTVCQHLHTKAQASVSTACAQRKGTYWGMVSCLNDDAGTYRGVGPTYVWRDYKMEREEEETEEEVEAEAQAEVLS